MATVVQASYQREKLLWKWRRAAYVSELNYQILGTLVAFGLFKEREKEKNLTGN